MSQTYTIEGVILNRRDYGEADRIVTLFTPEKGKLTVLAKAVRKLNSKRLSSLEIGTLVRAQIVSGKSMDILSQTLILDSYPNLRLNLASITQLYQLLEIIDLLTREEQEQPEVYSILTATLAKLNHSTGSKKQFLLDSFQQIIQHLGFSGSEPIGELNLKSRIETIAAKKLHTKDFFSTE